MSIAPALHRIVSTLTAMLHTRLDLMSVELEEELLRFASYFIYTLIAFFCGGVAILLILLFVIALFWDDHRMAVLLSLIVLFSGLSIFMVAWLRTKILNKPQLLEQTITEFKKDAGLFFSHKSTSTEQPYEGGREL